MSYVCVPADRAPLATCIPHHVRGVRSPAFSQDPIQPTMSDTSPTSALQQFVERSRRLYSLPAVALEVIDLTSQPTVDTRALKACIEKDPALTTRVLRVVNSSLFGLSRQVVDLNQALALLGIKPLKMLVLGFSLPKDLFDGVEGETLRRYWRHTVVKAVACRLLAERLGGVASDEAFLAGLLQDIGQLVLIQDLGPPYIRFLDHVDAQRGDVLALELETLGFDHAVLSARLLEHWRLPPAIAAAVAAPQDVDRILELPPAARALPQLLHLAELITRTIEHPEPASLERLLAAGRRYAAFGFEQLDSLVLQLQEQVKQLAAALAVELTETPPYQELLRAAHERLAEVSLEGAIELAASAAEQRVLDQARSLQGELQAALIAARISRPPSTSEPPRGNAPIAPTPLPPQTTPNHLNPQPVRKTPTRPTPSPIAAVSASDPGLLGRVIEAIAHARVSRTATSLALVQVDDWDQVLLRIGPPQAIDLLRELEIGLASWTQERGAVLAIGDAQFALVWSECPRRDALDSARLLLNAVKTWQPIPGQASNLTLSIGVATLTLPPKNFPPQELIDAARRCLSGAQLSGGDTVKSLEF